MGTDHKGGRITPETGDRKPKRGKVTLVVSEEEDVAEKGDCGGILTHQIGEGSCVFLVSHADDGVFRTSTVTNGGDVADTDEVGANDMTTMGVRLTDALRRSEEDGSTLVVCFDSLTDLLRYNDEKASYVFMHLLTGRLRSADAVGHVHLDTQGVEETTMRRFKPLFDSTVTAW
jgi:hypothetical protein